MAKKSTSGRKITGRSVRRRKRKFNLIAIGGTAAVILLFFFGFFYVSKAEVVGSTRYTETQVRNMVMDSFLHHNSIILRLSRKNVVPDNAPFISNIEVTVEGHNKVRLVVDEKVAAGYIEQNGTNYYFSDEGLVLDAIQGEEGSGETVVQSETVSSSSGTSSATSSQPEYAPLEAVPATTISTSDPAAAEMKTGEDSEYRPAVSDVPKVTGVTDQTLKVGETIKPICADDEIFTKLQTITRLVNRFDRMPDSIDVSDEGEITLSYSGGEIRILLGKGELLEDQMSRVSAILPQLEGMSGTLHLENFDEDTVNIVFDPKK